MICWYYFRVICAMGILLSCFNLVYSGRRPKKSIINAQIEKQEIDLNKPAPELDETIARESKKQKYQYNKNNLSRQPELQKIYKQRWKAKIQQDPERLKRMREAHKAFNKEWQESLTEEKKAERKERAKLRARKNRLKRKQLKQDQLNRQYENQHKISETH